MNSYKLADGSYSSEYKIGDKFEVVDVPSLADHHYFDVGDIITFTENDDTISPYFDDEVGVNWWRLKPYKDPAKQFTKSDLRDGMICTSRNGEVHTVQGDRIVDEEGCYILLRDISDDLTGVWSDLDIMKVEQPTVLFTREDPPVKSPAQIELEKLQEQMVTLHERIAALQQQADKLQGVIE